MTDRPVDLRAYRTERDLAEWRKRKAEADLRAWKVRRATWLADEIAQAGGTEAQSREMLAAIYGEDVAAEVTEDPSE